MFPGVWVGGWVDGCELFRLRLVVVNANGSVCGKYDMVVSLWQQAGIFTTPHGMG